jgi:uncharacterized protein (DUF1330 family)
VLWILPVAAFVITDLEVFDIEHYLAYQQAVRPLLAAAGARYLARGGPFRVYEGDYQPRRLVVLEFPSLEAVDEFYASAPYQSLETQRRACSSARIIAVEGL